MNGSPGFRNRLLNSKAVRRLCGRLGVDPHQYRLLLDLFDALGNRQEFMNTTVDVNKVAGAYFGLSSLLSLIVFARPPLQAYLSGFIGYSMLILSMTVLLDAVNSLMNPDEASVLSHLPIRGSTYVAAKLTHLLSLVAIIATAMNLVPAIAGLYLAGASWFYPLSHLLASYLAGLFIAFLFCGFCGWLFLFISPAKLKAAALWLQLIALVVSLSILRMILPRVTPSGQGRGTSQSVRLVMGTLAMVCGSRPHGPFRISGIFSLGSRRRLRGECRPDWIRIPRFQTRLPDQCIRSRSGRRPFNRSSFEASGIGCYGAEAHRSAVRMGSLLFCLDHGPPRLAFSKADGYHCLAYAHRYRGERCYGHEDSADWIRSRVLAHAHVPTDAGMDSRNGVHNDSIHGRASGIGYFCRPADRTVAPLRSRRLPVSLDADCRRDSSLPSDPVRLVLGGG